MSVLPLTSSSATYDPQSQKPTWLKAANAVVEFVGLPAFTALAEKGIQNLFFRNPVKSLKNSTKALGIMRLSQKELGLVIAAGAGIYYGLDSLYRLATHQEQWKGLGQALWGLGFAVGSAVLLGSTTWRDTLPQEPQARTFFEGILTRPSDHVTRTGEVFSTIFEKTFPGQILAYSLPTGNVRALINRQAPSGMGFKAAWEPIIEALKPHFAEVDRCTILHVAEEVAHRGPLSHTVFWNVEVSTSSRVLRGDRFVFVNRTLRNSEGQIIQTGKTTLIVGKDPATLQLFPVHDALALGEKVHTQKITKGFIESFVRASEDNNPIHTNKAYAQELGLESPIAHGMSLYNLAERFLGGLPKELKVKFTGIARLGDELHFYRQLMPDGKYKITAINQEAQLVMEMTAMV